MDKTAGFRIPTESALKLVSCDLSKLEGVNINFFVNTGWPTLLYFLLLLFISNLKVYMLLRYYATGTFLVLLGVLFCGIFLN